MAYGDGAGPDAGGEWDGEWDLDPHGERGGYEDDGGPPTSWMPRSQERPRRRGGRRGIVLILLGVVAVAVAALAVVVPKMMSSTENVHLSSGSATASRAATTSAATSSSPAAMPGTRTPPAAAGVGPSVRRWFLHLQPMPQGTVRLVRSGRTCTVTVTATGLTPGSVHAVTLSGRVLGHLAAGGGGSGTASFQVPLPQTPWGSRIRILNGGAGTEGDATTPPTRGPGTYHLEAVETGEGTSPSGAAVVTWSPVTRVLSVTLTASALSPGAHAAHIHVGSCASQGPVQHMLMDFTADSAGHVSQETRTVSGVTSVPTSGLYLNLHQGDSSNILSNGQPTALFRSLLCANF